MAMTTMVEWSGWNAVSDMCVRVWNSVANASACCCELGYGRSCRGGCALERNDFVGREGVQCGDSDYGRHCAPQLVFTLTRNNQRDCATDSLGKQCAITPCRRRLADPGVRTVLCLGDPRAACCKDCATRGTDWAAWVWSPISAKLYLSEGRPT